MNNAPLKTYDESVFGMRSGEYQVKRLISLLGMVSSYIYVFYHRLNELHKYDYYFNYDDVINKFITAHDCSLDFLIGIDEIYGCDRHHLCKYKVNYDLIANDILIFNSLDKKLGFKDLKIVDSWVCDKTYKIAVLCDKIKSEILRLNSEFLTVTYKHIGTMPTATLSSKQPNYLTVIR